MRKSLFRMGFALIRRRMDGSLQRDEPAFTVIPATAAQSDLQAKPSRFPTVAGPVGYDLDIEGSEQIVL